MALRFDGGTAVITGAGGTIGRAVCRQLATEGAAVVDLHPGGLQ
jgi:NAD(P)-dependent dehydrogenase (short-subunit alcohol dehydrogenase family)